MGDVVWQYMSSMGQKTGMLKTEKKVRKNATQKALVSEYQNLNSGSLPWWQGRHQRGTGRLGSSSPVEGPPGLGGRVMGAAVSPHLRMNGRYSSSCRTKKKGEGSFETSDSARVNTEAAQAVANGPASAGCGRSYTSKAAPLAATPKPADRTRGRTRHA